MSTPELLYESWRELASLFQRYSAPYTMDNYVFKHENELLNVDFVYRRIVILLYLQRKYEWGSSAVAW